MLFIYALLYRIDVETNQFSVYTFPGAIIPDLLAVVCFAGLHLGRKKAFASLKTGWPGHAIYIVTCNRLDTGSKFCRHILFVS